MKTENQMLKHEKSANRIEHQNRKTEVFWHKNRKTDQKNIQNHKTENPSAPLLTVPARSSHCIEPLQKWHMWENAFIYRHWDGAKEFLSWWERFKDFKLQLGLAGMFQEMFKEFPVPLV